MPYRWIKGPDGKEKRVRFYTEKQKAERRERERKRYHENGNYTQYHKDRVSRYKRKVKLDLIAAYGGKCACCGEDEPDFLTVDHTNNDGREHRRKCPGHLALYRDLRDRGYPKKGFCLMCFNCNIARSLFGVCPHKRKKP